MLVSIVIKALNEEANIARAIESSLEALRGVEGEVVLANGIKIQALGAGMKFRGVKHNNNRPSFVLIDDLEDEDNTNTEEKRTRLARWVSRVLLPACRRARMVCASADAGAACGRHRARFLRHHRPPRPPADRPHGILRDGFLGKIGQRRLRLGGAGA